MTTRCKSVETQHGAVVYGCTVRSMRESWCYNAFIKDPGCASRPGRLVLLCLIARDVASTVTLLLAPETYWVKRIRCKLKLEL